MGQEKMITRKKFGIIFAVIGVIIFTIGSALPLFQIPEKVIYDLPYILIIIGAGISIFGLYNFLFHNKLGENVDLSPTVIKQFLLNNAIIISLIIMVIIIACIRPQFMQIRVMKDILTQSSTRLIIALGISFTLLIGGTDLSAGRMVGLAAVISASMMQTATYANRFYPNLPQIPVIWAVLAAILACGFFGAVNGLFVSKFSLPPFIGTLAVQVMVYGTASLYVDMKPNKSQPIGGIRPDFSQLGQHLLLGKLPILIVISLSFAVLIWFILNKTVFGKNVYAIGGNKQAAIVSGINVPLTLMAVFIIASLMYGVGGVLEAARTSGATNNYGIGYELDAIAACVVGGISLNGGVGKVQGIIVGVLIFTVISYGLTFIGLNPMWQQIIKGLIIASSVAIDLTKYTKK